MKKYLYIYLILISLIFISCGTLLQKRGMKNFKSQTVIDDTNINDYQYDFIYLSNLLEEGFPNLDIIFPKIKRDSLKKVIINNLSNPDLENKDFILHTRKYLSNVHNRHTSIYLKSDFNNVFPYDIFTYRNGWYLLNISKQQDSLQIGKKILKMNNIAIPNIEKHLFDFTFAENKINQQYEIRMLELYTKPEYLRDIGIIENLNDSLEICFADSSKIWIKPIDKEKIDFYNVKFPENKITKYKNETYFYETYQDQNFIYLQFNKCHDKIDILDGIESYVKPWLQPLARWYVKYQLNKKKPSRQIAPYYNPKYPIFKDFVWELIDSLNNNDINNLIIDLRNNPGGNLILGVQLIYFLTNRTDLKGFAQFAYTSENYKNFFVEEYDKLLNIFPEGVPINKIIPTTKSDSLFSDITNKNSKYYISPNRPVFTGNVYILANYRTGSAAALLTTLFQDNGIATVIGTSVGNNPIGPTTFTPFKLPKTKANGSIATTYMERPNKNAGNVQIPDYWIEYSIDDLFHEKDPFIEKVIELIK